MELKTNDSSVKNETEGSLAALADESVKYHGYENWWESLSDFREVMKQYVTHIRGGGVNPKFTVLGSGHTLDHHAMAYFAPLHFKRVGFDAQLRTPAQHLHEMSKDLKAQGIRFIYVALPGKLDVYPEIAAQRDFILEGGNVNPVARNFLNELLQLSVEVVDCYPEMVKQRHISPLFSKGHHISLEGARLISDIVAGYLMRTTDIQSRPDFQLKRSQETVCMPYLDSPNPYPYHDVMDMSKVVICDGAGEKPYLANEVKSKIAVIGNCNLQSYEFTGGGIPSNLAFNLNYPVTYLGRYLPFAPIDRVNQLPNGSLYGIKVLLYVGFVSAPFVRAPLLSNLWNIDRIPKAAFINEGWE